MARWADDGTDNERRVIEPLSTRPDIVGHAPVRALEFALQADKQDWGGEQARSG